MYSIYFWKQNVYPEEGDRKNKKEKESYFDGKNTKSSRKSQKTKSDYSQLEMRSSSKDNPSSI